MIAVESETIAKIGYDINTSTLRIEFVSGGTYDYSKVDADTAASLIFARSHGKYFHARIRGKDCFPFRKVEVAS